MADRLDFQKLSFGLRRMGWIRFWIQVVLGIVVLGVLLFNNIGGSLAGNSERAVGLGPGLSLTSLAFLVLLFSLWHRSKDRLSGFALNSKAQHDEDLRNLLSELAWMIVSFSSSTIPCFCSPMIGFRLEPSGIDANLWSRTRD